MDFVVVCQDASSKNVLYSYPCDDWKSVCACVLYHVCKENHSDAIASLEEIGEYVDRNVRLYRVLEVNELWKNGKRSG